MELDLSTSGVAYRSMCARALGETASAPCPPASTSDCIAGSVTSEGEHWRISLPLQVSGIPNLGEARLTTDGLLMVDYINPTWSAGYFRRLEGANLVGGCRKP